MSTPIDPNCCGTCAAIAADRESEPERPEWLMRFLRLPATSRQAILEEVLGREITGTWPPFWSGLYGEVRERGLVDKLRERMSP